MQGSSVAIEETSPERAVLVAVRFPCQTREDVEDHLDELESLVATMGGEAVARVVQARDSAAPGTFIGKGKLKEIRSLCISEGAGLVIFDDSLSPAQVKNLEKQLQLPVMERTGVILDIFERRARTHEAKCQVELARLEYALPRLTRAWTHLGRQVAGGVTQRGVGEKQLELDRRYVRQRIDVLKEKLERITRQRDTRRRGRSEYFRVAIVGYTNSGKSTLMNRLTDSRLLVEDKLFATLDSSIRTIQPTEKPPILLSDTVGFIRKLPHSLVASFKSTFEEVGAADLLLLVVDLADPHLTEKLSAAREALDELGLGLRPRLLVFNKVDALAGGMKRARVLTSVHHDPLIVSAATGEGVAELRQAVYRFFEDRMEEVEMELDYGSGHLIHQIFENARISHLDYGQDGIHVRFKATKAEVGRLEARASRDGTKGD